jgi:hypothetical protein
MLRKYALIILLLNCSSFASDHIDFGPITVPRENYPFHFLASVIQSRGVYSTLFNNVNWYNHRFVIHASDKDWIEYDEFRWAKLSPSPRMAVATLNVKVYPDRIPEHVKYLGFTVIKVKIEFNGSGEIEERNLLVNLSAGPQWGDDAPLFYTESNGSINVSRNTTHVHQIHLKNLGPDTRFTISESSPNLRVPSSSIFLRRGQSAYVNVSVTASRNGGASISFSGHGETKTERLNWTIR